MELTVGFSNLPYETFIFDALVNQKIDTEGLVFTPVIEKTATLDKWVFENKLDLTRASFDVYPRYREYIELTTGITVVEGIGPILVTPPGGVSAEEVLNSRIAVPGEYSVGHLLLLRAFPGVSNVVFMGAEEIEAAVLSKTVDAGILGHEHRFTCQQKGLVILADMAERWKESTGQFVPVALTLLRAGLDLRLCHKINKLVGKSAEYARAHYPEIPDFTKQQAPDMSEETIRWYIDSHVNEFTVEMRDVGEGAMGLFKSVYVYYEHSLKSQS